MAHLHLLGSLLRLPLLWLAAVIPWVSLSLSAAETVQRQEQINVALRSMLELADSGDRYLTYDRAAASLRLQQDRALLRACPVVLDDLAQVAAVDHRLDHRVRHYRHSHAYASLPSSPFDWEQYLVADADAACALSFATGVLIYASPQWAGRSPRPPSLRIAPADLRALYNTLAEDASLIILPPGWDALPPGHER